MLRLIHEALKPIRSQVARPASARFNLQKTLAQTLTMWLVFLVLGPLLAFALELFLWGERWHLGLVAWRGLGATLFVGGGVFACTSAWWMVQHGDGTPLPTACPRRLVVLGTYRYVRNPMAMGSLTQGVAAALILGSFLALLYSLAGIVIWNQFVRPWEERDLERRFGLDYLDYKDNVRCWIARRTPYIAP